MKILKKLVILLLILIPIKTHALDEWSEWSREIPLNNKDITIRTEERYLYYELVPGNIEYAKYGTSKRKYVDLKDFKYDTPYETREEVESDEYKEVSREVRSFNRFYDDARSVRFEHTGESNKGLRIKDLSIIDNSTGKKINFTLKSFSNIFSYSDNDILINSKGYFTVELDNTYNGYDVRITYTVVREKDDHEIKEYTISYLDNDLMSNFGIGKLDENTETTTINEIPLPDSCWVQRYDIYEDYVYVVKDKLFKYYDLERKDIGYYKNLEGDYLKDEKPVLFYSYKFTTPKIETVEKVKVVKEKCENSCEYLENEEVNKYPIIEEETSDNEEDNYTSVETNTNESKEDDELLSYNTNKVCNSENCRPYKIFAFICLIGILFLLLIVLISSLIRRIKEENS